MVPNEEEFTPHRKIVCLAARPKHVEHFVRELRGKRNVAEVVELGIWMRAKLHAKFAFRMQTWTRKEYGSFSWTEMLRTSDDKVFLAKAGVIAQEVLCEVLKLKKINSVAFVVTLPSDDQTGLALVCAIEAATTATGIVMEEWKSDYNSMSGSIYFRGPEPSIIASWPTHSI